MGDVSYRYLIFINAEKKSGEFHIFDSLVKEQQNLL